MLEKSYRVHGRVQGVGFRWWTVSQARRLGLVGSVRNCPDGTVEVHARGPEPAIRELETLLRQGPPGAEVERLDETDGPGITTESFEIAR